MKIIQELINLLYPAKCPFCREILSKEADGICASCKQKIEYIQEPRCKKCGKPVFREEKEYCYDCEQNVWFFEEGRNLWVHKPPVSEAIYSFKYHNMKCYGKIFGKELSRNYASYIRRRKINVIVPVPLHKKRKRYRGYNQAEIIAKEISERVGIPCDFEGLVRLKKTNPQKKLGHEDRRSNIKDAFKATKSFHNKNVLLIDDIYTTGNTLNETAKVLKKAGARNVYFLTISIGQGF